MRTRPDTVFISCLLFTIAFLCALPGQLTWALASPEGTSEPLRSTITEYVVPLGWAGLSHISVGLLVTWTGYLKRVRWAWFVMFIIVWMFAFPVLFLPFIKDVIVQYSAGRSVDWGGMFLVALKGHQPGLGYAELIISFISMMLALLLPISSFFGKKRTPDSGTRVG